MDRKHRFLALGLSFFLLLGAFPEQLLAARLSRQNPIVRKRTRGDESQGATDEALWGEVLSPLSVVHPPSATSVAVDLRSGIRLSESWGTSPSDMTISTVFSPRAASLMPRLAEGPSIRLGPGPQQQPADVGSVEDADAQSVADGKGAGVGAADPPPPELDMAVAMDAGRLASIAYCSRPDLLAAWNCTRCAAIPSFQPHRVVYDPIWDVAGYVGYHPGWKAVVLSFRGTDSSNWGNWAENMRAWRTDHMYPEPGFPHALIHAGFYSLWTASSMQGAMTAAVSELMAAHPGSRLVATGHSMGGALAQLAGLELKFAHNASRVTVFTFGAPRVGNLAYQQLFNLYIDESWRFTHNRDIVPSVPLQIMGFQHVAREVWEVDVEDASGATTERKLLLCDATGEDPSCHNSACYLGLCTSIADHLKLSLIHI